MGRRFLLQVLAGVAMTLGVAAAPAAAAEVAPVGSSSDIAAVTSAAENGETLDPVTVEVPGVVEVTVEAEPEEQRATIEVKPTVEASEADVAVAPEVTAIVSPSGPALDVTGPATVGGQDLPVGEATDPVEEAVGRPAPADPAPPAVETPAPTRGAGEDVAPAPAPIPSGSTSSGSSGGRAVPTGVTRGVNAGSGSVVAPEVAEADEELAPEIADAAVRREAPAEILALPVVDTTPDVPALLRLMTGLMVLGAGMTWRRVQASLA